MKKRYRRQEAKPGELKAYYGVADRGCSPDVCVAWGAAGAHRADGRVLLEALSPEFFKELVARGYDITTLKFSIRQKAPPANAATNS